MPNGTLSRRVTMPPSNFGARASRATAWNSRGLPTALAPDHGREELAIADLQLADLRFVRDLDAHLAGRVVVGVDHRLAAAQHEDVRPGQVQGAVQRPLPAHPML